MTDDLQKQFEQANDMLQMLSNQRNASQNECVQLGAALAKAQREIDTLKKRIEEYEKADVAPALKSNGHAEMGAAA